ncbi:MAG: class I SAM-dependent methyltransferase [bacterium]
MKYFEKILEECIINSHGYSPKDSLYSWSNEYFFKHKKRYAGDLKIINEVHKEGAILEIGAAPYHMTVALKILGFPVTAVDVDPSRFSEYLKIHDLNVIKCDIENEKLPFNDNHFKLIIFNEVFEHLRINPIATLKELNRILHPNGKFIISTPNLYAIENILYYISGKGFDNAYKQFSKLETIGHMGHVRIYTSKQIKKFLKNCGYKVERTMFRDTLVSATSYNTSFFSTFQD